MVRFVDCFWDMDFNGSTGYEALSKRLKDGRKMCDDLVEFIRVRAKAEDDYGKTLIRLVQQTGMNEEIGSLKDSWDTMKKETESIGNLHCEVARRLEEVEQNLKTFRDNQHNERRKADSRIKQLQKQKKSEYENLLKSKRMYEQRCKEYDAAEEALESAACYTPKEEDKLRARKLKAKTTQDNADNQYQYSVKMVNGTRELWEKEMENCCEQFQGMEEERIKFLRNEMWVYSNVGSQCNVDEDKLYENIRLSLENCDDEWDIQHFIQVKQTGLERPPKVVYENYYHPSKQPSSQHRQKQQHEKQQQQQQSAHQQQQQRQQQHHKKQLQQQQYQKQQQQQQRAAQELPPEMQRPDPAKLLSLGRNTQPPRSSSGPPPLPPSSAGYNPPVASRTVRDADDSAYSSIQDFRLPGGPGHSRPAFQTAVRAVYDYNPQGPEELLLKKGDPIEILKVEDKTWAFGRNLRTRREGVFPKSFVDRG